MAYDKVIDSSALDSKLKAVADAIRGKTGNTDTLTLEQMPTEIEGIEIATKVSLQDKTITVNGTYTADTGFDGLGQVIVNVPTSSGNDSQLSAWLSGTITDLVSNTTKLATDICYERIELVTATLPNATWLGESAFYHCTGLVSINAPSVNEIGASCFDGCSSLAEIRLPLITSIKGWAFRDCSSLIKADFSAVTNIYTNAFYRDTALKALILRKANSVASLGNVNALTGSGIANGTGYIYVPRTLIDSYKAAKNWSTYESQFRALEDYTVDGTTTGALDESKI